MNIPKVKNLHKATVVYSNGHQWTEVFENESALLEHIKDRLRFPDVSCVLVSRDWRRAREEG